MMNTNKKILASVIALAMLGIHPASATVYQVKNVTELVDALGHQSPYDRIELQPGTYDLTGVLMKPENDKGGSHLFQKYISIKGMGPTPWATKLVGDGQHRVVEVQNDWFYQGENGLKIENVCITNGYAVIRYDSNGNTIANSGNGGGVYGYAIFTNSVIIGCKADTYGGANSANLYASDSQFINNTSWYASGAIHNPNWYRNCQFIGNRCEGSGNGGAVTCNSAYGEGRDSVFENNYSKSHGGAIAGTKIVTNCVFRNNRSDGQGGAVYNATSISLYDCLIEGNRATYGGGVLGVAMVSNCVIRQNYASEQGGGALTWGSDYNTSYKIIDSVICSNSCNGANNNSYGGGLQRYYAINCKVFDNYSRHGGGDNRCVFENCDIYNNYGTGNAGAMYASIAYNSRIWDNIGTDSPNGYVSKFIGCDVSGTGINGGMAYGTIFHDIGRVVKIKNQYVTATVSNCNVWAGNPVATNCAFVMNRTVSWGHDGNPNLPAKYGSFLFGADSSSPKACTIVNCTVASNALGQTFSSGLKSTHPWIFENCLFKDNAYYWSENCDLVQYDADMTGCVYFRNCAYGAASHRLALDSQADTFLRSEFIAAGSQVYRFGYEGMPPKANFCCEADPNAEYPFELRFNSAARGLSSVMDWMTDAYDVRGAINDGKYKRLRDGKADLGAYQCWRWPEHTTISVR